MTDIEARIQALIEARGTTIERVGEEIVGGHLCRIYEVATPTNERPSRGQVSVNGGIWIGNDDLIYKITSSTQTVRPRIADVVTGLNLEATCEYDDALTIPLPE